jgi:8-oxo-dGTP diphosphatase
MFWRLRFGLQQAGIAGAPPASCALRVLVRELVNDNPRPMLTVDTVVLTRDATPSVLLVQRENPPFAGNWALPGGFVDEGERVVSAARRELEEETGLCAERIEMLGVYDTPGRDPRGWTVSVVYLARVPVRAEVKGGDDARDARWFTVAGLPELAFDHAAIVADALRRA